MREIKFKVWDKVNKIMVDMHAMEYFAKTETRNQDRFELMQYTGLKDKNGKEIYEGDIIRYLDFDMGIEGAGDEYQNQGIVKYDDNLAMFYVSNRNEVEMENLWLDDNLEIIGNIYENKDLLT